MCVCMCVSVHLPSISMSKLLVLSGVPTTKISVFSCASVPHTVSVSTPNWGPATRGLGCEDRRGTRFVANWGRGSGGSQT